MSSRRKTKKKITRLMYQEKVKIYQEANAGIDLNEIAAKYKIGISTIKEIKKNTKYESVEQEINLRTKTIRPSKYKDFDNQLKKWCLEQKESGKEITQKLLCKKAKEIIKIEIPSPKKLLNFLELFKRRYNIELQSNKAQYKKMDQQLFNWLLEQIIKKVNISDKMLSDKTWELMNKFDESSTNDAKRMWLYRFKKCHKILTKPDILQIFDKKNDATDLPDLNKQLLAWLIEQKKSENIISHKMLIDKTSELMGKFNKPLTKKEKQSWLCKICKRYNKQMFQKMNEILKRDDGTDQSDAKMFIQKFSQRLEKENISRDNIYSIVKPDLIWKTLLSLLLYNADERKIEEEIDITKLKENHSIIIFCRNVTGSHKLQISTCEPTNKNQGVSEHRKPLLVLHKLKENISTEDSEEKDYFVHWYNNLFKTSVREHQLEKNITGKVLLLIDNCVQHIFSEKNINTKDDDFEIVFLPTNIVSLFEPLYPEIIKEVNHIFYNYLLKHIRKFSFRDKEFDREYNYNYCISTVWKTWQLLKSENIEKLWNRFLRQDHRHKKILRHKLSVHRS